MKVLVIDDDPDVCAVLQSLAGRMGLPCIPALTLAQGLGALNDPEVGVVFLDVNLPDGNGLDALPAIKDAPGQPEVIILTGQGSPDGAELAIRGGAWDYLVKPSPLRENMLALQRAISYHEEKTRNRQELALDLGGMVAVSPAMRTCLERMAQAARSHAAVLITGETGVGKELVARVIHANSLRAGRDFVAMDCAALTGSLLESTLFGHRKGSFTGADSDRIGLVRLAHGGALFLDEVGELPPGFQKSFLRVLQEKRFRPLGASREEESDFRLMAATNRDLEALVERGEFRSDLFFRLQTLRLCVPPLRQRPEDIPLLAETRVLGLCQEYGLPCKTCDDEFLELLQAYPWPGNVRQLFSVMEQAVVAAGRETVLFPLHLPEEVRIAVTRAHLARSQDTQADIRSSCRALPSFRAFKEAYERDYLERLYRENNGDLARMLEISGLSRSHLYALLKKYEITD